MKNKKNIENEVTFKSPEDTLIELVKRIKDNRHFPFLITTVNSDGQRITSFNGTPKQITGLHAANDIMINNLNKDRKHNPNLN
jgi:hypothetical protein